jgi:hypothetical protein
VASVGESISPRAARIGDRGASHARQLHSADGDPVAAVGNHGCARVGSVLGVNSEGRLNRGRRRYVAVQARRTQLVQCRGPHLAGRSRRQATTTKPIELRRGRAGPHGTPASHRTTPLTNTSASAIDNRDVHRGGLSAHGSESRIIEAQSFTPHASHRGWVGACSEVARPALRY